MKIVMIAVTASLVAISATGKPLEEWNFSEDSLFGELDIYPQENISDFFAGGDNADVSGNDTWTLNRTDDKWSWHNLNGLGLSSTNMDSITFAVKLSSWDMTTTATNNNVSFGMFISNSSDQDVGGFTFKSVYDGTNQYMVVEGSAGNSYEYISGGTIASGNTGTNSIQIGVTFSWTENTYTFWQGNPNSIISSNALPSGVITNDIEHMKFFWTGADAGDFLEIDQIQLYTDGDSYIAPPPPVVIVEDVVEEWNFTGGSTTSENGVALNFNFNEDTSGNDWYNVTTNGWGWGTPLTNLSITSANTEKLILSVTLNDYDFNASQTALFGISLTGPGWTGADVRLDCVDGPQMGIQGNVGATWASAGAIKWGDCSGGAVTYGLMFDFKGGAAGTGSYSYWTGSPGQWSVGWTWGGESGDIDLSGVTIDTINVFIDEHLPGDRFGLDQIKVYKLFEVLQTPEILYDSWLGEYAGMGAYTNQTDNPDYDELNNLYEYALGGDPMTPDTGIASIFQVVEDTGVTYVEYIHAVRDDAAFRGLTYHLETDTDLLHAPGWVNSGYTVTGTNINFASGFVSYTNRAPTDAEDQLFIKLNIEGDF